jgi:hypothetical protein
VTVREAAAKTGTHNMKTSIHSRDGVTLNVGDTAYYSDSVELGFWADPARLQQHMAEEGYPVSLYNGDEGCVLETVLDEDDVLEAQA